MKKWILQVSLVTTLVLATGCATSFQANELEKVSDFPKVKYKKTVYVDLAYSGRLNGEPWSQTDEQNRNYLKQRCIRQLRESGMFIVVSDKKSARFTLNVALINEREADSSKEIWSMATLYIIPYTTTDSFRSLSVLKHKSTGREYRFSFNNSVTHRQSLLLIPLSPFKPSGSAVEKCTDRIFENLCMAIHSTGLIR